ncbi:hypothetical protein FB472_2750 [Rhodoglobus vestalii]|uniref:Antitoxin VbhA domain-containing protein n=1 Tax=Rhodoglobus vestalii TaxID=193384 RepID=A0A8H2PUZ1_9MICO|nr:hypothetical protein [Rhodoglobus vestalii]TQO21081.1 hypothetical protein FB472_2750 [Rhodoglobus vestalii]
MTTVHTAPAISAAEQLRRRRVTNESIHSLKMEGLTVSDWHLANIDVFVTGDIELDELIARGRGASASE